MNGRAPRAVPLVAALAATLLVAGCGGATTASPAAQQPAAQQPAAQQPAAQQPAAQQPAAQQPATKPVAQQAVAGALAFTGKTLDGAPFDAATLAGKPALLWFWAPWCATCASQASSITTLREKYGDRLAILGIAGLDDDPKALREFVTDLDVGSVTHLDDRPGEVWRRFKVVQQSSFVLVDRKGAVVHTGWLDDVDLTAQVTTLVG